MTSISLGLFRGEKIGAIAAGLLEGLLTAPFGDFGVIATNENLGNTPAAEIGRAGVVGEIEERVIRDWWLAAGQRRSFSQGGKRFVLGGGLVAEGARNKTRDGVNDESGGEFAAAEDEIADGNFVSGEVSGDALVHAFVTAADEDEAILLCEAARGLLSEAFACSGEKND